MTEAIRGEGATLHDASGERFVDELAPRDEVSRAIQSACAETRAALGGPRHAGGRPGPLPERVQRPARGRAGPDARAGAGRAGGPLHDGRDRRRPRRPLERAGPVCGRRGLLHGPARRQPAGLQLAQRVLRVRRAARSPTALVRAAAQPPPPRADEAEPLRELPAPPAADAEIREALWRDAGIVRDAEGLAGLLAIEHPLVRCIARCALARTESRGAHLRSDHPERDPALDRRHVVLDGPGRARLADLGLSASRAVYGPPKNARVSRP